MTGGLDNLVVEQFHTMLNLDQGLHGSGASVSDGLLAMECQLERLQQQARWDEQSAFSRPNGRAVVAEARVADANSGALSRSMERAWGELGRSTSNPVLAAAADGDDDAVFGSVAALESERVVMGELIHQYLQYAGSCLLYSRTWGLCAN
jgi:hypothetical protein